MAKRTKKDLFAVLASISSASEMKRFFSDITTPAELEEMQARIELLRRLIARVPQRTIAKELGVSLATISRGSRVLQHGSGAVQKYLKS